MNVTILPDRLAAFDTIALASGGHDSPDEGMCFNEAAAWLTGGDFNAQPDCVSPVIRGFTTSLNDQWDDTLRQQLKPYVVRAIGTGGDGLDEARSYLALDWLIRTYTPAWLDLAGLTVDAAELRALRRIVDLVAAEQAGPVVRSARTKAEAAGAASRAASGAAFGAAAGAASGVAAGAASGAAFGAAAGAAAWAAARAASLTAARAAAGAAAGEALRPTVQTLQASALDLLDRMIDPGRGRDRMNAHTATLGPCTAISCTRTATQTATSSTPGQRIPLCDIDAAYMAGIARYRQFGWGAHRAGSLDDEMPIDQAMARLLVDATVREQLDREDPVPDDLVARCVASLGGAA